MADEEKSSADDAADGSVTVVEPPKAPEGKKGPLGFLAAGLGAITGLLEPITRIAINVGILLTIGFGVPTLYKLATHSSFVIRDISVPSDLEERGFTGEVFAQQILDQIGMIDTTAGSRKEKADISGFDLASTMPAIQLPVGGLNLTSLIAELRQLLGYSETRVTGEVYIVTPADEDKGVPATFGLRLRIAGEGAIYRSTEATAHIDQLVDRAAQAVMQRFDPINLGYYLFRTRSFDRANDIVDLVLSDDKPDNDAWAYTMRGLILREQGRYGDASQAIRLAIDAQPNFWLGYSNLALLLRLENRLDEAETAARKAIELAPKEQEGHSALALILLDRGQSEAALAEFKVGLDADPQDANGHLEYGRALLRLSRFEDALAAFRRSAALKASAEPLVHAANASKALNKQDDAKNYLSRAAQIDPKSPTAWAALGEAAFERKDFARGIEAFRKAESLDTSSGSAMRAAAAMMAARHVAEAETSLAKASVRFPGQPDILLAWSEVLWAQGKKADANLKLKAALTDGAGAPFYEQAGRILEARGEIPEAITAYQGAISRDPRYDDILKPQIERLRALRPTPTATPGSVPPAPVPASPTPAKRG